MSRYLEILLNLPLHQSFTYAIPDTLKEENLSGRRVEVDFGSRRMTGYPVSMAETLPASLPVSPDRLKTVRRVIDKEAVYGQQELELARRIAAFYLCSPGEALAAMIPSGRRESGEAGALFESEEISAAPLELSIEQQKAVDTILDESDARPVYLFGLTGTGKTEVFLRSAEVILARGRGVLYLVPEISLTHQVEKAIKTRFGDTAAVLHSGLTGSRRLGEWMRIRRGQARIVIGARSAIFAPLPDPGLIIIDEEHDGSYKSGTTPRYHARQVAMMRCKGNTTLVMGSATPSLEAWKAVTDGTLRSCTLTRRLSGGEPPRIEVIPLKDTAGALSPELQTAIQETSRRGRQTILFLNRRGFTHVYRCKTCGYTLHCRHCAVPLTLHKKKGIMKCHYCGWQTPPPVHCPECGSLDAGYAGFGTEFIEEEVRRTFTNLRVERIDTDSISGKDTLIEALSSFRDGKTDILLGTQMVAKGLNFPGVSLVGIVLADTGLNMPDFRAAERVFALIMQVAGRAGRFFPDGRVLIQTWDPSSPAISYAGRSDLKGFYEREMEQRRLLGFPPFSRLIRLVFRSKNEKQAMNGAAGAAEILETLIKEPDELLGPAECPVAAIAGNFRYQVILKGEDLNRLRKAAQQFLNGWKAPGPLYIEVDVDPVHLL